MTNKNLILLGLSCLLLIGSISALQIRNLQQQEAKEDLIDEIQGAKYKWHIQSKWTTGGSHGEKKSEMKSYYSKFRKDQDSYKSKKSAKHERDSEYSSKKGGFHHKKDAPIIVDNFNQQSGYTYYPIQGKWPKTQRREETIFVEDIDNHVFYEYTVTNKDCKVQISVTDQNGKCWFFEFKRFNEVVFVDAINNIILVQEINSEGAILSLYIIEIIYDVKTCMFFIDFFSVNSIVDDEFFYFNQVWWIGEILEYNPLEKWIAITKITQNDVNVYKIFFGQKVNILLTVGWFGFDKKRTEEIDGGNSKVLYDRRNDELMIDQNTCRVGFNDPTVYKRVPICDLVPKLPLYRGQGTTVNYVSWFFQYISKSKNEKELTTFLYWGYGDKPIVSPVNIKSDCPIIYRFDDYSYFAAITDKDIYLTTIELNEKNKNYEIRSDLLSKTCTSTRRSIVLRDWTAAVKIVFIEGRFFLLTKKKFIVYSDCPTLWTKVYEEDCLLNESNDTLTIFKYIRAFLKRKY